MSGLHPAQLLFTEKHPLTAEFNMTFQLVAEHVLQVTLRAPGSFADHDNKYLHTGFNTLLLDTVMGSCAIGELKEVVPIATVKLTANHIRKIPIGEEIWCKATWESEENSIAYVSGEIRFGKQQQLASSAIATFMIGTTSKPLDKKNG